MLKNLYGPVGIMSGKFYAGEEEDTAAGHRIPAAPALLLPARAAVRLRDLRFLCATPDLAAALATAADDGRDVFEHTPPNGRSSAPPSQAVDLLTGQAGEPAPARLLSDRRGSRVWKIQGPKGAVA
ncbi:hypothetical protein [Streptomyces sp. C10]|uniref:hypothetical protein n=1 Tax=Streptomyces sp. C10 TaxID=531941 RepID=UPI00397EFCD6